MKIQVINMKNLRFCFLQLLFFTFLLHTTFTSATLAAAVSLLFANLHLSLPLTFFSIFLCYHFYTTRTRVYMLNYACYKPPPHRKCSYQTAENFVSRNSQVTYEAMLFMRNIYLKSGLGDETYAPQFIFEKDGVPKLNYAIQEAQEGVFSSIDALLRKTLISPEAIDIVVVISGSFSPTPSLSSLIVNRYKLRPDVKTYNLSGMGCSSGVISIDFVAKIIRGSRKVQNALIVITESITLNWYSGDNRSMLVTNCIFRVGCAAVMLTNDPRLRRVSKMERVDSLRTHHGADDSSYRAAFQEEDDKGNNGISLTKDLIRVAGMNLREHIKILAPRVLPLSQIVPYAYSVAFALFSGGELKPVVPDFKEAFEHICIHTGGKAVIDNVGRVLKLADEVTEPARMTLNRFGNTSSSLVFYELAYFEAKERAKMGDRMWMIAFGTGFKVGSLVWKWLKDSSQEFDNPWNDCIQNYPVKAW